MRTHREAGKTSGKATAGQASAGQATAGQAIVEYVLALAIIISIVTVLSSGFRRSLYRVWEFYGRQISAPCPGCPSDVRMR